MNPSDLKRFELGASYPGGKSGSGVCQQLINLMPPHEVYIEPFLGGGAVMRRKRPALLNMGVDLDPAVAKIWNAPLELQATAEAASSDDKRRRPSRSLATPDLAAHPATSLSAAAEYSTSGPASGSSDMRSRWEFRCEDGIEFLRRYPWTGRELVYCDPPYLHSTRRDLRLYGAYELSQSRHIELLDVLRALPVPVLLSGYESALYGFALRDWSTLQFQAMTRRGPATETVWYNFSSPEELHDYRFLGADRRERERIKRMQERWRAKLAKLSPLERQALRSVFSSSVAIRDDGTRLQVGGCR